MSMEAWMIGLLLLRDCRSSLMSLFRVCSSQEGGAHHHPCAPGQPNCTQACMPAGCTHFALSSLVRVFVWSAILRRCNLSPGRSCGGMHRAYSPNLIAQVALVIMRQDPSPVPTGATIAPVATQVVSFVLTSVLSLLTAPWLQADEASDDD